MQGVIGGARKNRLLALLGMTGMVESWKQEAEIFL